MVMKKILILNYNANSHKIRELFNHIIVNQNNNSLQCTFELPNSELKIGNNIKSFRVHIFLL